MRPVPKNARPRKGGRPRGRRGRPSWSFLIVDVPTGGTLRDEGARRVTEGTGAGGRDSTEREG